MRGDSLTLYGKGWFRDLDSNQDTQLQRLMSYRLDDPGSVANTVLTSCRNDCLRVNRVKLSNFRAEFWGVIRHSIKLALHKIRTKMSVAVDHLLATMPNPLLDDNNLCTCHDQSAAESVHTAAFQAEFAKQGMEVLIENGAVREWCLPFRLENKTLGSAVQMRFQHLHHVRLDVDPSGCFPGFRSARLLAVHALVDADDVVFGFASLTGLLAAM